MATTDTPGHNPVNNDKLARGCWAEHKDGSLVYVKDIDENDRVIFEMFDLKDPSHPLSYSSALSLIDFRDTFTWDPKKVGKKGNLKWTWHDKTPFPWDKIMKLISSPTPQSANVVDTLSAAERVAASLAERVTNAVTRESLEDSQGLRAGPVAKPATSIRQRIGNALRALRR